jgi:hypothetical protein
VFQNIVFSIFILVPVWIRCSLLFTKIISLSSTKSRWCVESSVNLIDPLVFFFHYKKEFYRFFTNAELTIKTMHFASSEPLFKTELVNKTAQMQRFSMKILQFSFV